MRKKKTLIFSWMSDKSLSMLAEPRGQFHHTKSTLLILVFYSNMAPKKDAYLISVTSWLTCRVIHSVFGPCWTLRLTVRITLGLTNPICWGITLHNWQEQKTNRDRKWVIWISAGQTETLSPLCTEHVVGWTAECDCAAPEDKGRRTAASLVESHETWAGFEWETRTSHRGFQPSRG